MVVYRKHAATGRFIRLRTLSNKGLLQAQDWDITYLNIPLNNFEPEHPAIGRYTGSIYQNKHLMDLETSTETEFNEQKEAVIDLIFNGGKMLFAL